MSSTQKDKNSGSRKSWKTFLEEIPEPKMSGESFWSVSDKPRDPEKVSGGFLVNRKDRKLFLLTFPGPRRPEKHVGRFSSFRKSWHLFVESRRVSGKPSRNVFAESGFRKNAPVTGAAFSGSSETCQKRALLFGNYGNSALEEIQLWEI
ncbi:MAG: hypothetical protein JWM68_651 [Verrucomicrobiales bacterium]|nr:hypothetical protein [Verrucomicrobiales bacterium]